MTTDTQTKQITLSADTIQRLLEYKSATYHKEPDKARQFDTAIIERAIHTLLDLEGAGCPIVRASRYGQSFPGFLLAIPTCIPPQSDNIDYEADAKPGLVDPLLDAIGMKRDRLYMATRLYALTVIEEREKTPDDFIQLFTLEEAVRHFANGYAKALEDNGLRGRCDTSV